MKSYTESVALLNSLSKIPSTDTTNTALLTQLWNDSVRTICSIRGGKWRFLETTKTVATVASQQGYQMPAGLRKIIDLYITVGTTVYRPRPIYNPDEWNKVLSMNLATSDVPWYYYVQGTQVLIAPTPSSSSNTITIRGRKNVIALAIADVTTSTVTSIANGGTAMVINAGGLASMAGKYIRITNTGVANTGDGLWYEIASATATTITLVAPYEGTSIAAGTAACTIGQMTPIPDAYDMAPIYRAMALFTQINDPLHPAVSAVWWKLYDGGNEAGFSREVGGLIGQMLQTEGETTEGAYISPNDRNSGDYGAPYWQPFQDATGF